MVILQKVYTREYLNPHTVNYAKGFISINAYISPL
jgi:hypothetical protein